MSKVGDRVVAIQKANDSGVYIYGYGTFNGDQVPPKELGVRFFGIPLEHPNAEIVLDDGNKVYGCECWWGDEERAKKEIIKDRPVFQVDITEDRKEAQNGSSNY